jgi:PAS domain S-box-containing protein
MNILYLEDNRMDVDLVKAILETEKLEFTLATAVNRQDYIDLLLKKQFDIILIDYKLPQLDGLTALQIANDICSEVPAIIISGTIGEEKAVETMKAGAVDYILKNNISRLVPVLERTLEWARLQKERKLAEIAVQKERDNFRNMLISMEDGVCIIDQHNILTFVNPALDRDFGPWQGRKCYEYFKDRKVQCPFCHIEDVLTGKTVRWESNFPKNQKCYDMVATCLRNPDNSLSKLEIFHDITERKKIEIKLIRINSLLHINLEINQLIVREKDSDKLIKKICEILTRMDNYTTAWILLLDKSGKGYRIMDSKVADKHITRRVSVHKRNLMNCCQIAAKKSILFIDAVKDRTCLNCPLNHNIPPGKRMISQLKYESQVFGYMGISATQDSVFPSEESTMLSEIADNLSFALHSLRIENQRHEAVETIKENVHLLQALIDALPIPLYYKNEKRRYLGCNDAYSNFFGMDKNRIRGKTIFELLPEPVAHHIDERDKELLRKRVTQQVDQVIETGDGRKRNVVINKATFMDKNGDLGGLIGVIFDITPLKEKELALTNSEKFNRQIIESSKDCITVIDLEGNLIFMNSGGQALLEIDDIKPYLSKPWIDLWKGSIRKSMMRAIPKVRKGGIRIFHGNSPTVKGTPRQWEVMITPITSANGSIEKFLAVSHDITQQKKTEQVLRESLKEKEILLKELHHRVKNNLMIIISLLQLTSKEITDKRVVLTLIELQNRIHSLALVHDKLYRSGNLNKIKFSPYIKDIIRYLCNVYMLKFNPVNLKMDIEDRLMSINIATPCGLVINELVTNSLKHAFTNTPGIQGNAPRERDKMDEIQVKFFQEKKRNHKESKITYTIIVRDNGKGMPNNIKQNPTSSLGLRLVNILVKQLSGTMEVDSSSGTTYTIRFAES